MNDKNASEELAYHKNSTGVIDYTFDDNGINLLDREEEVDITSIQSKNETNYISMNDDEHFIHK